MFLRFFSFNSLQLKSFRPDLSVPLDGLFQNDPGLVDAAVKQKPAWTFGQEVKEDDRQEERAGESNLQFVPALEIESEESLIERS